MGISRERLLLIRAMSAIGKADKPDWDLMDEIDALLDEPETGDDPCDECGIIAGHEAKCSERDPEYVWRAVGDTTIQADDFTFNSVPFPTREMAEKALHRGYMGKRNPRVERAALGEWEAVGNGD